MTRMKESQQVDGREEQFYHRPRSTDNKLVSPSLLGQKLSFIFFSMFDNNKDIVPWIQIVELGQHVDANEKYS